MNSDTSGGETIREDEERLQEGKDWSKELDDEVVEYAETRG